MFGFLFTLTVLFLAYVAYDAYGAIQRSKRGEPVLDPRPRPAASPAVKPPAPVAEKPAPAPATAAPKPVAARKAPPVKASPAPASSEKLADQLRNPATGEVCSVPTNYRFAKKWIKEALVAEKLLDKVYKPKELDDTSTRKAREAIERLRALKKYQA